MKYSFGLNLVRGVSKGDTEAVRRSTRGGYYGSKGVTDSVGRLGR